MKTLPILIFILFCLTLSSQTESKNNKWLIGNSFNFNFKKNESFFSGYNIIERNTKLTERQFNTTPFIGKQLNSKWLLGLELGYSKVKREERSQEVRSISSIFLPVILDSLNSETMLPQDTINVETSSTAIIKTSSFGFTGRRYFRVKNKLQLFLQTSLNLSYQNNHTKERRFLKEDGLILEPFDFSNVDTKTIFLATIFSPGVSWNFNKFNITAKYINLSFLYGKRGLPNLQVQNFSDVNLDLGINKWKN